MSSTLIANQTVVQYQINLSMRRYEIIAESITTRTYGFQANHYDIMCCGEI